MAQGGGPEFKPQYHKKKNFKLFVSHVEASGRSLGHSEGGKGVH
jgi:hypothetical protein